MSDLFPEFTAEVEAIPEPPPPRPDMWLVLAVWNGGWSIPSNMPGPWFSREVALERAASLGQGWKHRRIVRIPGEQP